jgi:hypothetical protein
MKKLGMLFGCDVLLDTEDEEVAKSAIAHMEELDRAYQAQRARDFAQEIAALKLEYER